MTPADFLRNGLRALRLNWGDHCPAGAPVPDPHRCSALDCDAVPLTQLAVGESAAVTCLEDPASRASGKLAALGVLPGVRIALVQRWPAFVFRLGHSEFAVDAGLARHIRVRR